MHREQPASARVLHIVGVMNRGGVETWLMNILRNIDKARFSMDFVVHTDQEGAYDTEIRELGSAILPCLKPGRPFQWARNFRGLIAKHGPYDVVHSHVHHFSGIALACASNEGIGGRVAHSHTDTSKIQQAEGLYRKGYYRLATALISRYATAGLAPTEASAFSLYGPKWKSDQRFQIMPYGIDLAPFRITPESRTARMELGIPEDIKVIGHVGRFAAPKNHDFIVEIARSLLQIRKDVAFVLAGDGTERGRIEHKVNEVGLRDNFVFLGNRSDVATLMRTVFDVFIMPSKWEGLPLAALEAQAAGLQCVLSEAIPTGTVLLEAMVDRIPIDEPSLWAEVINRRVSNAAPLGRNACLQMVTASPFNVRSSVNELEEMYGKYV